MKELLLAGSIALMGGCAATESDRQTVDFGNCRDPQTTEKPTTISLKAGKQLHLVSLNESGEVSGLNVDGLENREYRISPTTGEARLERFQDLLMVRVNEVQYNLSSQPSSSTTLDLWAEAICVPEEV